MLSRSPPKKTLLQKATSFGQSAIADPNTAAANAKNYVQQQAIAIRADPNKAFADASKAAQGAVSSGISSASSMGQSAINKSNLSIGQKFLAKTGLGMMSIGAKTANMGLGMAARAVSRSVAPQPPKKSWYRRMTGAGKRTRRRSTRNYSKKRGTKRRRTYRR